MVTRVVTRVANRVANRLVSHRKLFTNNSLLETFSNNIGKHLRNYCEALSCQEFMATWQYQRAFFYSIVCLHGMFMCSILGMMITTLKIFLTSYCSQAICVEIETFCNNLSAS